MKKSRRALQHCFIRAADSYDRACMRFAGRWVCYSLGDYQIYRHIQNSISM